MKNIFSKIKINKYQEQEINISISAFEVFKRLYPSFETIFLLESLGDEGKYNRFSYIGFDPSLVISAKGQEVFVNRRRFQEINPYSLLPSFSKLQSRGKGFCGGLVGFFSHEATRYFEPAFAGYENNEYPDYMFGLYLDGLKFDKKNHRCTYFHFGESRLAKILSLINNSGKLGTFSYKRLSAGKSKKEYKEMVLKAKKHIMAGDIFQAVLSVKSYFHMYGDKRRLYAALRGINPSPYMFYLKFGEKEIITASPELLIHIKGKEIEHFGTLAGTIQRGKDKTEDAMFKRKLQSDEKELAEHLMLVDLARNDMGRICQFGSIRVENMASVKRFSHVQHLFTGVKGRLKDKEDCFSAFSACFPAGTLTGAPKIEAMKIIRDLEGEARGPYGGVGGYFSLSGEAMLAITIRSIFINGNQAYTQTGSGIVFDSTVEKEYQEIMNKQKAMEEALRSAQGKPLL